MSAAPMFVHVPPFAGERWNWTLATAESASLTVRAEDDGAGEGRARVGDRAGRRSDVDVEGDLRARSCARS